MRDKEFENVLKKFYLTNGNSKIYYGHIADAYVESGNTEVRYFECEEYYWRRGIIELYSNKDESMPIQTTFSSGIVAYIKIVPEKLYD